MTARSTYPLMLWTSVQKAAAVLAAADGLSSNLFIVRTEEQIVGIVREAGVPGTEIRAVIFMYDVAGWSRFRIRDRRLKFMLKEIAESLASVGTRPAVSN